MALDQAIPRGLCQCGCGRQTRIAKYSLASRGYVAGEPVGYCRGHYPRTITDPLERLWRRVEKQTDGCWTVGKRNRPLVTLGKDKQVIAARYVWASEHGEIPDGMVICHSCDNPLCVNPEHLWLGTTSENARDMHRKGRNRYGSTVVY